MDLTPLLNKVYFAQRYKALSRYDNQSADIQMKVMRHLVDVAKIHCGVLSTTSQTYVRTKTLQRTYLSTRMKNSKDTSSG